MKEKFRKRKYLKMIFDNWKKEIDPSTFIYPEAEYLLSWSDFFILSELPIEHRQLFKEEYRKYYITSNSAMIDSKEDREIDTLEWMKLSYTQMSHMKDKFPYSYERLLRNFQNSLLKCSYTQYNEVPIKVRSKFEDFLFTKTDSAVKWYDNYYNEVLE